MGYGIPKVGGVDRYNGYARDGDDILASYTPAQQKFYRELDDAVREHYQHLQEIAEMPGVKLSAWYRAVKRSMDLFVGILGLILLSPLFLVTAILIKIDSRGTVFFNQERVGKGGKLLTVYKFRTMVVDAEKKTGAHPKEFGQ